MTRTHPIFNFSKPETKSTQPKTPQKNKKQSVPSPEESFGTSSHHHQAPPAVASTSKADVHSEVVLNVSSAQSDGDDAPDDPLNPHLNLVIKNEVESGDPKGSEDERWATPRMPMPNEEDDSVIRIAKRRLTNRQQEIIPPQPALPAVKPFRAGCWETMSKWPSDAWNKVVSWANVLWTKSYTSYLKFKQKKDEWDRWNPDKNHPIVHCIDESKLAGLKETVKPNRGILYR
jgi:hypothetical protein